MQAGVASGSIVRSENLQRQIDEPCRGCLGIVLKRGEGRWRLVRKIGLAPVDQPIEVVSGQS